MPELYQESTIPRHFQLSKKALADGQALCSRAKELSGSNANILVDALGVEAKIKWLNQGVLDQLSLAASVAKSLSAQRTKLLDEARLWDTQRTQRNQALDAVLESLGTQLVPPSLHQMSSGSSLFGSQHSLSEPTILRTDLAQGPSSQDPKSKWKSLRDFVDEKGIELTLDGIEEERSNLDDVLGSTAAHAPTLNKYIADIRNFLPSISAPQSLYQLLSEQEETASEMAAHLESLAAHFEQMSQALHDHESGNLLSPGDIEVLVKDTEELPSIIEDLERSVQSIESINNHVIAYRDTALVGIEVHHDILSQLEGLESTMDDMLEEHYIVESRVSQISNSLQSHHTALAELEETYHSYQLAYDQLIVEMDRRKRYRDGVQTMIERWTMELGALRDEELLARERFIADHGGFLPDDLCPYVSDMPVRWTIEGDGRESNATLSDSIVLEAKRNLGLSEEKR
ncbi:autophagy-related protein 17 [Cantharellus anzutake]|uniref:autophagy-related protein 17 n=1 Tax=Cantharellus anzutake TaxID=1750568 RepID=UPI0019044B2B|nr:autophagy-related protein 17 [Cantharellus anzutake]KAF8340428.1 autophagy-related protein 17 [Cantharellus anzutake]